MNNTISVDWVIMNRVLAVCAIIICALIICLLALLLYVGRTDRKGEEQKKLEASKRENNIRKNKSHPKRLFSGISETDEAEDTTRMKYRIGKAVLYIAMGAMAAFVFVDIYAGYKAMSSDLIERAFEAFKLITTTVLGYMFGSSNSKNSER